MPHMPFWHMPPPQPPEGCALLLALLFAWAANVEYSVVRRSVPQEGQWMASASALRRTSFSNLVPQSSHLYSKIGMPLS
jgi:hypothetical protein